LAQFPLISFVLHSNYLIVSYRYPKGLFSIMISKQTAEHLIWREVLHPQEGAEVPPLTAHQMWNLSNAPMEFLVISQPNSRDDRVFVPAPSDSGE
jgi:hypothetical protein